MRKKSLALTRTMIAHSLIWSLNFLTWWSLQSFSYRTFGDVLRSVCFVNYGFFLLRWLDTKVIKPLSIGTLSKDFFGNSWTSPRTVDPTSRGVSHEATCGLTYKDTVEHCVLLLRLVLQDARLRYRMLLINLGSSEMMLG